jgi:hypothetical protein
MTGFLHAAPRSGSCFSLLGNRELLRHASSRARPNLSAFVATVTVALFVATALLTGCGSANLSGGSSTMAPPPPPAPTAVVLEMASTANDQFSLLDLQIESIDLVNQSGGTVNLFTGPTAPGPGALEFTHLNGGATPVLQASVPSGVYVGAKMSIGFSRSVCIAVTPDGGIYYDGLGYGASSFPEANLSSPVTLSGRTMVLTLNLEASQSASLASCAIGNSWVVTPTFSMTPAVIATQPTSPETGKLAELKGQVSSTTPASNSMAVTLVDSFQGSGPTMFSTDAQTAYFGVAGLSGLSPGMFVDLDAAIQSDGSFLATRIAVEDSTATNAAIGLLLSTSGFAPAFTVANRQFQGASLPVPFWSYSFSNTTNFQISSEFTNVSALPFSASFTGANMVGGQNVYVSSLNFPNGGSPYTPATTVTLLPQTIDGTVSSVSNDGNFDVYTVTLAPYDLFPTLPAQTGLGYTLNDPNQVTVYADSSTQMLNSAPIAPTSVARFHGLIFNDNGNLRMDCNRVNDGVPE